MAKYILDPNNDSKIIDLEKSTINNLDPFHFETDIQNLQDKVTALKDQIKDIEVNQIPAIQTAWDEAYDQFPDIVPARK